MFHTISYPAYYRRFKSTLSSVSVETINILAYQFQRIWPGQSGIAYLLSLRIMRSLILAKKIRNSVSAFWYRRKTMLGVDYIFCRYYQFYKIYIDFTNIFIFCLVKFTLVLVQRTCSSSRRIGSFLWDSLKISYFYVHICIFPINENSWSKFTGT